MISDDREYSELLKKVLKEKDYKVKSVPKGYIGIERSKEDKYDLVIIDIHRDRLSVIQILEMILLNNPRIRVMIISEKTDENEELQSLVIGAKEYLSKEKSFGVILERIKKIIEKDVKGYANIESKIYNIQVNVENRIVYKKNEEIYLTNLEYELLVYFLLNKNKSLSREVIYKEVWQVEKVNKDIRAVDTYIKKLRKKLDIKAIRSKHGVGYCWFER